MKTIITIIAAASLLAVMLTAGDVAAAGNSIVGTWNSTFAANGMACSVQSIYESDHTYSELLHCGNLMTHQSGTYVMSGDLLVRTVEDWAPKQQWVVGSCVGCGYWQTMDKPPGGSYRVNFISGSKATLHDVNLGGTLTIYRSAPNG